MVDLYIYYRSPRDNASHVLAAARRLLDAVAEAGLAARTALRWRDDDRHPEALTWMEIYEACGDPALVLQHLEDHPVMADLLVCLSTPRHVERFFDAQAMPPEVIVCA